MVTGTFTSKLTCLCLGGVLRPLCGPSLLLVQTFTPTLVKSNLLLGYISRRSSHLIIKVAPHACFCSASAGCDPMLQPDDRYKTCSGSKSGSMHMLLISKAAIETLETFFWTWMDFHRAPMVLFGSFRPSVMHDFV